MLNTAFPPWPSFSENEADAVREVVLSNKVNYWTGQETRKFEKDFALFTGCEYAIATANGTLALDLALKAIGVGSDDEVIVTPRTFIASISCVVTAGAKPVFADVDIDSQNLTAETIAKVVSKRTKAVVVVHLAGMPAEMDEIMELASEYGFFVIEDCAQAHGATYKGRSVGSIGHIGAWSFCQDKIMSTGGEGGMVTTNDSSFWKYMWSYKDHGKSWDAVYNKQHPPGFRWVHEGFGTNWRMTELQGVLGRIQIKFMKKWHKQRIANAEAIWQACSKHDWLRVPSIPSHSKHAAYKAYVFIEPENLPVDWNRSRILDYFEKENIPVFSGTCSEVYLEKAFDGSGFRPQIPLTNASKLGETSLMFLVHPTLERKHIDLTIKSINSLNQQIQASNADSSRTMLEN